MAKRGRGGGGALGEDVHSELPHAFLDLQVLQLASLIKSKQVSSVELVEIYTARLQQ